MVSMSTAAIPDSGNLQTLLPVYPAEPSILAHPNKMSKASISTSPRATAVSVSAVVSVPTNPTLPGSSSFRTAPPTGSAVAQNPNQRGSASSVSSITSVSTVESNATAVSNTTSRTSISSSSISAPTISIKGDTTLPTNSGLTAASVGKLPRATLEQKLQVIDYYHRLKLSQVDVVELYKDKISILTSSLSDWIKNEHELRSRLTLNNKNLRRKVKFKYEKINHAMDLLVQSFQANNKPINEPILREYWSIYAHQYGVDNPRRLVGFSHGWLMQFKKRHGLFKRKKFQPSVNPLEFPKIPSEEPQDGSSVDPKQPNSAGLDYTANKNSVNGMAHSQRMPHQFAHQLQHHQHHHPQQHNGQYLPPQQTQVQMPLQLPLPQRLLVWQEYQSNGAPPPGTPSSVPSQSPVAHTHHHMHPHHQRPFLHGNYPLSGTIPSSATPLMHHQYANHGISGSMIPANSMPLPTALGASTTPNLPLPRTPSHQYPISFPQIQQEYTGMETPSPIPSTPSRRIIEGEEEEMVNSQGEVVKMRLESIIHHE